MPIPLPWNNKTIGSLRHIDGAAWVKELCGGDVGRNMGTGSMELVLMWMFFRRRHPPRRMLGWMAWWETFKASESRLGDNMGKKTM
jgi:hypothetical protein